eukprot:9389202-Lingulodinium_polyedra.AAC.1
MCFPCAGYAPPYRRDVVRARARGSARQQALRATETSTAARPPRAAPRPRPWLRAGRIAETRSRPT